MGKWKLIVTVGLPRSGKSTWAREESAKLNAPVVNPDSIRLALHGEAYIASAEPFVWAIARTMVCALFLAGHDEVIVDATNTSRKRRDFWQSEEWETVFQVIDTEPGECIVRAVKGDRDDLIPVIERMNDAFEDLGEDERGYG